MIDALALTPCMHKHVEVEASASPPAHLTHSGSRFSSPVSTFLHMSLTVQSNFQVLVCLRSRFGFGGGGGGSAWEGGLERFDRIAWHGNTELVGLSTLDLRVFTVLNSRCCWIMGTLVRMKCMAKWLTV